MSKYRLVYHDRRARGDVSRFLFKLAGVEFEDKRITQEEWPQFKKSTLFGQLPYLEVDDETIYQSRSIERFLARRFGMAGKTDIDQARVDMIMECMEDSLRSYIAYFFMADDEKKAAFKKKVEEEVLPNFMNNLEKYLKSNKGGDGFFVGDELTVADLSVIQLLTFPEMAEIDHKIDNYPKLKAHKERVESVPEIAQWIANRPKTKY